MAKKAYQIRNWSSYNKSLAQRGSLTFWFSEDLLARWAAREDMTHGNQQYPDLIILSSLTIRQLFRLPLRATQGMIQSLLRLMNTQMKAPDYTTLCRRSKTLKIDLSIKPTGLKRHVLVDSTGVRVFGEGEWKVRQHGLAKRQLWRKLHITIDESDQTILSAKMTRCESLDGNQLPELLEEVKGEISQVTGDGAYDKKECYRAVFKRGAKPVFPPQHNAIVQRNKHKKEPALNLRDEVIEFMKRGHDPEAQRKLWKETNHYHRRSLIESMMWRMKTLFGDEIRSRSFQNQCTDLMIRCRAINHINTLGMPDTKPI